jgi:hypothetical protein
VVTSDHGATPMVEQSLASGHRAYRVKVSDVVEAATAAVIAEAGNGEWVAGVAANSIYMSDAFLALPAAVQSRALDAVVARVSTMDGVGFTARSDRVAGHCENRSGMEQLACMSIHPDLSGEVFTAPGPFSVGTTDYLTGTSHGTPNPEDRYVPIVVFGPGLPARVAAEPASLLQVAPTIAALLGISPPVAANRPPLIRR